MVLSTRALASKGNSILRRKECCDRVVRSLDQYISIPIQGKLSQRDIFKTLIAMAVNHSSIHSICHCLSQVPCETSVRYHLKKLKIDDLEQINSSILSHFVGNVLKKGHSYQFAIDFTHDCYYGKAVKENESYIIRNRLKKSTNEFYSYITLYVTTRNHQFTLSVFPIRQGLSKVHYLAQCLDVIKDLGLQIKVLCLDREFYAKKVFSFLEESNTPFIIPVRRHSKQMKILLKGTKFRFGTYIMKNKPLNITLKIAIVVKYLKGRGGKKGEQNLGYVYHGITWNPERIHNAYRSRFSIESSYRMRNQVKPKTSSRNPVLRYIFTIISFLLKNNWMVLLWTYFSPMKRGPKTINPRVFRFEIFTLLVWEFIKHTYKCVCSIIPFRRPV